jgi:hypothetical protein
MLKSGIRTVARQALYDLNYAPSPFIFYFVFEIKSPHIARAALEPMILLSLPPE